MIRLLMIVGLVAVNFFALLVLINTLHRFFATGPADLGGVNVLLGTGAALGFVPIVQGARLLTNKIQITGWRAIRSHAGLLNIAAILTVLFLWQLLLPWYSTITYSDGVESYEQGKLDTAIDNFDRSIYQHSDNPAALLALATIYEETKDDEKAKQFYKLVIPSEVALLIASNNLARLYLKDNEPLEAIELLLRAQTHLFLTTQPDDDGLNLGQGVISKNLAWAYWIAEDTARAEEAIKEADFALKLAGAASDYPEIYCLQAILLPQLQTSDLIKACEMGFAEREMSSLDISLLQKARKQHER